MNEKRYSIRRRVVPEGGDEGTTRWHEYDIMDGDRVVIAGFVVFDPVAVCNALDAERDRLEPYRLAWEELSRIAIDDGATQVYMNMIARKHGIREE